MTSFRLNGDRVYDLTETQFGTNQNSRKPMQLKSQTHFITHRSSDDALIATYCEALTSTIFSSLNQSNQVTSKITSTKDDVVMIRLRGYKTWHSLTHFA